LVLIREILSIEPFFSINSWSRLSDFPAKSTLQKIVDYFTLKYYIMNKLMEECEDKRRRGSGEKRRRFSH